MKKIYKAYPTGCLAVTLENFAQYGFYVTGKFYDYIGREQIFQDAEVLMVGQPQELEYGKFIPNRYFGRIKNMGFFETMYLPETDEVTFEQKEILAGKILDEDAILRLKRVVLSQCHSQEQEKNWSTGFCGLYIEVDSVCVGENNSLFLQKKLHDFVYDFQEQNSEKTLEKTKKDANKFYLADGIYYDLNREVFMKKGEKILFAPYNSDFKKKFLNLLILHRGERIPKEEIFKTLGLKWMNANRKLLELKRGLIEIEFMKYLGLDKNLVQKTILISEKNQWYRMIEYDE